MSFNMNNAIDALAIIKCEITKSPAAYNVRLVVEDCHQLLTLGGHLDGD